MLITYLGHSCFKIKTKETTLITDPFDKSVGINPKKIQADIVTVSHQHHDHNNLEMIEGKPLVFNISGEYESKGIFIYGFASFHDEHEGRDRGPNTIFLIEAEDLRICHLGDLGHLLPDKLIDELNGVDVLMIPVGGVYTINAKEAQEIINKIEPSIVIPMHYWTPKCSFRLDKIDEFTRNQGVKDKTPVSSINVNSKTLNREETETIIMKPAGVRNNNNQ